MTGAPRTSAAAVGAASLDVVVVGSVGDDEFADPALAGLRANA